MMLFSAVNMKLRDIYSNLDEMCQKEDIDKDSLVERLANAGFEYSPEHNKFW